MSASARRKRKFREKQKSLLSMLDETFSGMSSATYHQQNAQENSPIPPVIPSFNFGRTDIGYSHFNAATHNTSISDDYEKDFVDDFPFDSESDSSESELDDTEGTIIIIYCL